MSLDTPPSQAPPRGAGVRPTPFTGGGVGFRGVVLIIAIMALSVGSVAMAAASFTAFSRVLMATVDSRLLEVANEIARHTDDGLKAGITLGQQQRLLDVLDNERSQAPELSALRVLDERNVVAFSTNRTEIGEAVAEPVGASTPILIDITGATGAVRRELGRNITIERPLTGLFGEPIGRVIVALPISVVADQRQRYATTLALAATGIIIAGGLIVALLVHLIPTRAALGLRALRGRLDNLFIEAADGTPDPTPTEPASIPDALEAFETSARQRLARLAEREATIQRLDEGA